MTPSESGVLLITANRGIIDAYDQYLWRFVQDPAGSGYCFIQSKQNGWVIDILEADKRPGVGLDAYPMKLTGADNQLWQADGKRFRHLLCSRPTLLGKMLVLGRAPHTANPMSAVTP